MKALFILFSILVLCATPWAPALAQKKPEDPIDGILDVDLKNYESVLDTSTKSVLVEFYAPWCGHCKAIAPEMELVGASYLGEPSLVEQVTLAKVNDDKLHELGSMYNVRVYPTLIWIPRGGKPADGKKYDGEKTAAGILEYINQELRAMEAYARVSELTDIAQKMAGGEDAEAMLAEAKKFVATLEPANPTIKANGALYVKYMENFVAKGGIEYVDKEIRRLNKLTADGMSPAKQQEVDRKLSVLTTFRPKEDED